MEFFLENSADVNATLVKNTAEARNRMKRQTLTPKNDTEESQNESMNVS